MSTPSQPRQPVYFLGVGGPNFFEDTTHPAYQKLAETGREITSKVRPKAVVVVSAHWQHAEDDNKAEIGRVAVNVAEDAGLIYDFYGFPPHYYKVKYPYRGSRDVAEQVVSTLKAAGVAVDRVERGLDHGVWAGFLAAFDPISNPLKVPIVQVSLLANEDPNRHYRLGQALDKLRDQGVLIVGTGMAVHNLRDFMRSRGNPEPTPYASSFEHSIAEAIAVDPKVRQEAMARLIESDLARAAHPTFEHLMPLHVVAGAAGSDVGERIWAMPEGSMNWAQYRFGSV